MSESDTYQWQELNEQQAPMREMRQMGGKVMADIIIGFLIGWLIVCMACIFWAIFAVVFDWWEKRW